MASQGMILRNNNLVGGSSNIVMPDGMRAAFEEGVYLIFMRWTALQLAIINEWGGSGSKDKAKSLFDEVLDWFYTSKGTVTRRSIHGARCAVVPDSGPRRSPRPSFPTLIPDPHSRPSLPADHELSDLQDLLDEAIQVDFNVQAEDDSPYMVARSLYNTYSQVASGDTTYVQTLKQQFEVNGTNQIVAESMRNSAQFLGGEESSSSSDDDDDDEDGDGMDVDEEEQGPPQPVVDEDGFQVVQRRGRR